MLLSNYFPACEYCERMFRKMIATTPVNTLWKVFEQYQKVLRSERHIRTPMAVCTDVFMETMGFRYSHWIADL